MDDLISRQAAIRWVKTECNPYGKPTLDFESGKKVIEHLERMSSAQPEVLAHGEGELSAQQPARLIAQVNIDTDEVISRIKEDYYIGEWIPCSERLPDEFGEYLVTKKAIGWNCEEYNLNDIAYFDNEGFHKADKVLAWMPLPEPYKGEKP